MGTAHYLLGFNPHGQGRELLAQLNIPLSIRAPRKGSEHKGYIMSNIKINRAKQIAGHMPLQERAVWDSISPALVERLTAAELADVANCLNAHWHKARASCQAECLDGTPEDGLYWLGGNNGVAVTMRNRVPVVA